jgi:hypothetical protein
MSEHDNQIAKARMDQAQRLPSIVSDIVRGMLVLVTPSADP